MRGDGWRRFCAWLAPQMEAWEREQNAEFNRILYVPNGWTTQRFNDPNRRRVENLNWRFEHDHEWGVTYAAEVSTGFTWPPSYSYGWSRRRPYWRALWI